MTETKPTNGLLTDRLNNTRTKNRPIWLTIDGSKPINDWWQTLHESFSQYHHGYTDQSCSTNHTYNIIDWQTVFTWLWRWLPLRLSKRQSPTTVLFRTTLTRTITLYDILFVSLIYIPDYPRDVDNYYFFVFYPSARVVLFEDIIVCLFSIWELHVSSIVFFNQFLTSWHFFPPIF